MNIIQWCIDLMGAETYLEIGVRNGDSFLPVRCANKIGVDISFPVKFSDGLLYEMSSDDYFDLHASFFDVAYIDGDHTYEQSLKDVLNCLQWMNPNGVILMDDCNPIHREWATPAFTGASPYWCGEAWKTILTLRTYSDLSVFVIDDGFGIGFIQKGKQEVLSFSKEQISEMTYQDLDANRELFLNLVKHV